MARKRPPTRLSELAATAVDLFIRGGYVATQMDDVARSLGVAKGTIYLYVESKDALFDLAIRFVAGDPVDDVSSDDLPLRTPPKNETFDRIARELATRAQLPKLFAALAIPATATVTVTDEAREILEELFDVIDRNRVGLKLLDRCAREMPDISTLWYERSREGIKGALNMWLTQRSGRMLPIHPPLAAWFIMEAMAFWAMHRHWDPSPPTVSVEEARREVVTMLLRTLVVV